MLYNLLTSRPMKKPKKKQKMFYFKKKTYFSLTNSRVHIKSSNFHHE